MKPLVVGMQELGDAKVLVRETVATIRQLRDEHRAKHDQWWAGEQVFPRLFSATSSCVSSYTWDTSQPWTTSQREMQGIADSFDHVHSVCWSN